MFAFDVKDTTEQVSTLFMHMKVINMQYERAMMNYDFGGYPRQRLLRTEWIRGREM